MSENDGLLISAISSFYQVWTGEKMVLCRARGKLRLNGTEPVPGDQVLWEWDRDHPGNGILTAIAERRNLFIRPNLANISRIVFVASAARPETDPFLVDCMSVVARENACDFMLCVNKTDLNDGQELLAAFKNCSFPVCCVSALTGEGIEALKGILMGGISVFTGNSGVGKSSLLNALVPELKQETGELSEKHGRGKHTTRHTRLFPFPGGGWVADTPGFAALEIRQLSKLSCEELALHFPEFPVGACRFPDCRHDKEPDCAVKNEVEKGRISASRYQSYLRMYRELKSPARQK